jgi:hypothetical protein
MLCSYDSINIGRFIYPPALVGYMEETTYMDIEPSWEDIAPMFCEWLENGTKEQKALARSEIQKMAVAAAHLRAQQKAEEKAAREAEEYADCDGEARAEARAESWYDSQREIAAERCYGPDYDF